MTVTRRANRWTFRVKARSDDLVTKAATLLGTTKTAFVEESAVSRAESVIAEHGHLGLSEEAFARFVASLDRAPVAIPELTALFSRTSRMP
jgi:uncharacterized protein (DUF1778 family)